MLWLSSFMYNATTIASIYIMVAFNIEVYVAIVHSEYHNRIFTHRSVIIIVIVTWFLSLIYPLSTYLILARVVNGLCYVAYNWQLAGMTISILNFVIRFGIPTVSFLICYLLIFKFLLAKRRIKVLPSAKSAGLPITYQIDSFAKARNNVAITLFYSLILHFLASGGNQILVLLYGFGYSYDTTALLPQLFALALYFNSCINPIIYVIKYERFRLTVKTLFCS